MQELPLHIKKSIGKYEPIEAEGLLLYPVRVENYNEFLIARQSLEFMQQSLPRWLINMPLLDAYFKIDTGQVEGMPPTNLFGSALLMLSLALRLSPEGTAEEMANRFKIVVDPQDPSRLKYLKFVQNGEEVKQITPIQFQRLRPILAAQNGITLVSDDANPELIQAERDLADKKAPKLNINIEALVSAAALITGKEEADIYEWAILKLNNRLASAKKVMDYMICGIGESGGTKWKGGNPCPNPWFDRITEGSDALISLDRFAGGQGLDAVNRSASGYNEAQLAAT